MVSDDPEPVLLEADDPLHLKLLDLQEDPAGLEQLQQALTGWRFEMEKNLRQGLHHLEDNSPDLDRLNGMLAAWRSEINIFDVLRLRDSEEFHSNFLAWLLDPHGSHGLGGRFLREFLGRSGAGYRLPNANNLRTTKVAREPHVERDGARGRLDIRILIPAAEFLCVIENKVWSDESEGQLAHYRQALADDYPGYRIHRVFLTPQGRPSAADTERDHWTPMSYTEVLALVEDSITTHRDTANQDVISFLHQYAITLRRNIVPDVSNDVHQLARRIYRKHQAAIDLIIENRDQYKPNYVTEGFQMVRAVVEERGRVWRRGTSNPPYFRFMSENWADYDCLKTTGWPHSVLLFNTHVRANSMVLTLVLNEEGDEALRRNIFTCVKSNPEVFDCAETEFKEGWITLHRGVEILTASDYENWWDEEAMRETISRRLDEFAETGFRSIDRIIVACLEEYEAEAR